MPETPPTPGQVCYEAYIATGKYPASEYPPWRDLVDQQRWEAAAQAVRAAYKAEMAEAWQHGQEEERSRG